MMSLTLGIILKTMFSLSIDEDELEVMAKCFNTALEQITIRMATYFLPEWAPLPHKRACREAVATLDAIVYRIIEERRESGQDPDDLLSMLLSARDEETGEGMTDLEIRDEVMVTLFGGYEATADALTWTWHLLDEHPAVDETLREEIAAVLGGRTPTFEDLTRLPYTTQVLQESMRLYPPFWFYNRTARGDDEVGGYKIPGGRPAAWSARTRPTAIPTSGASPRRSIPSASSPRRSPAVRATPTSPSARARGCASAATSP